MSKKDDGGPAFPGQYFDKEFFDQARKEIGILPARERATIAHGGMSLRDFFAAAAIMGIAARGEAKSHDQAFRAYEIADAMIRERRG